MPMMTFYRDPTAKTAAEKKRFFPSLRDRLDFLGENLLKEIQQPLAAELNVRPVAMKIGLADIFKVFRVILVQFDDFLDQRLLAGKIKIIQKTFRLNSAAISGLPQ